MNYNDSYLDKLLQGWDRLFYPILRPYIESALQEHGPSRILDFGAGAGAYAALLAENGAVVDACDISEQSVERCAGKYRNVFRINGSEDLPRDRYDMVFSSEVLEHIEDYGKTLRDIHGALKSRGMIFLTTTAYAPSVFTMIYEAKNNGVPASRIAREMLKWVGGFFSERQRDQFVRRWCYRPLGGHCHGFMRHSLIRVFREAGYRVLVSRPLYPLDPMAMPFLASYSFKDIVGNTQWPRTKRLLAAVIWLMAVPINRLFRLLGLFANNLLVIATKLS